jgi:hypothetical protein
LKFISINVDIRIKWKELDKDEKLKYKILQKNDKKQYEEEKQEYYKRHTFAVDSPSLLLAFSLPNIFRMFQFA